MLLQSTAPMSWLVSYEYLVWWYGLWIESPAHFMRYDAMGQEHKPLSIWGM